MRIEMQTKCTIMWWMWLLRRCDRMCISVVCLILWVHRKIRINALWLKMANRKSSSQTVSALMQCRIQLFPFVMFAFGCCHRSNCIIPCNSVGQQKTYKVTKWKVSNQRNSNYERTHNKVGKELSEKICAFGLFFYHCRTRNFQADSKKTLWNSWRGYVSLRFGLAVWGFTKFLCDFSFFWHF